MQKIGAAMICRRRKKKTSKMKKRSKSSIWMISTLGIFLKLLTSWDLMRKESDSCSKKCTIIKRRKMKKMMKTRITAMKTWTRTT
jgi:hypothetical protein